MIYKAILKEIKIRNSDTDSYLVVKLELDTNNIDINYLYNLKHKSIDIDIKSN